MRPAKALLCATRKAGEAFDSKGKVSVLFPVKGMEVVEGDPLSDTCIVQDHVRLNGLKRYVSVVSCFGDGGSRALRCFGLGFERCLGGLLTWVKLTVKSGETHEPKICFCVVCDRVWVGVVLQFRNLERPSVY